MSIDTSNFVVIRNGQNYKCKGDDLITLLDPTDEMFLQRGDTQYRFKPAVVPPTISSTSTVSRDFNFGQYLKIINPVTGQELTASQFCDACYAPSFRDPRRLFNGNDAADNRLQYATLGNSGLYSELIINFPANIPVYQSIEIKAGFHEFARTGQLLINGQVVRELDAWDRDPQIFSANYTGYIDTFSIKMKNLSPLTDPTYSNNTTGAINFIKVDGIQLLDYGTSTRLVMSEGTDMSQYKTFMRVYQKDSPNITGVIGEVDEPSRTITLFTTANFQVDSELQIESVDGSTFGNEVLDTDLLACTDTDNITYKVTGAQFKELLAPPEYDEEAFTRCVNERFLDLIDCKNGCDSEYCTSKCPEIFYINLEKNCPPLAPWYDNSMSILEIFTQVNPGLLPGTASVVVPNPSIVTVSNGVFYIDGVAQPSLSLNRFENIVFDQTDPSNDGHPLRIYEDESRTVEVTNGVRIKNYDNGGLPDPETDSADLRGLIFLALTPGTYYYQCQVHAGMGGTITVT